MTGVTLKNRHKELNVEIGINSFASLLPERNNGRIPNPAERLAALLEEITLADEVGIDVFGVGEHHRTDFADSSPAVILAAAAARTKNQTNQRGIGSQYG